MPEQKIDVTYYYCEIIETMQHIEHLMESCRGDLRLTLANKLVQCQLVLNVNFN